MKIYNLTDSEVAKKVQTYWKDARDKHEDWRKGAEEDFNFVSGTQWEQTDVDKLKAEGRPIITYNRCNAIVSAILGLEANQRMETMFTPREISDNKIADATTQVIDWVREYSSIESEESMAFEHQLICGMGWNEILMDYETDLDGKICQEVVSPLDMEWEPSARKRNLTDAGWVAHSKPMFPDEIKDKWPDSDFSIEEDFAASELETKIDTSNPGDKYDGDSSSNSKNKTVKPRVIRFQWYELAPVYRVADPTTGKIVELDEEKYKEAKDMLDSVGVPTLKQKKRTYYQAFVVGTSLLEKSKSPCQTGFSFKCDTGKHDEIDNSWYGIISLMKDPQRWSNKFLSTFLDIIDSNAKGGVLVERNAVEDVRTFEENYSKADSVIYVRDGAIQNSRIMNKPTAPYPQAIDNLLKFSISSIYDVAGVNLELLGMADRSQPGIVEESRKKSAYTILAPYFDSHRMFKKYAGLTLLEYVKNYMPEERIAQALDEQLRDMVPVIKQIDLTQMNVIVSESPQSDNNKQMTWLFIQNLLPSFLKMGIPVPPEMLDYAPIPAMLAAKWKSMLSPAGDPNVPPEVQMQKMKMQMQQMQQAIQQFQQENQQLKQQEAVKMQELAMKKELGTADLVIQQEKIRGEFALKQEEMQKNFEMELMKIRATNEMEMMKFQNELSAKRDMHMAEMGRDMALETHKTNVEAARASEESDKHESSMSEQSDKMAEMLKTIVSELNKPKKLVKDDKGRISGVITVSE